MSAQYYQCKMRRNIGNTTSAFITTGWIEARGAKIGATVELLPDKTEWEIIEVYRHTGQSEKVLKETQRQRRQGLPSLRDSKKVDQ